MLYYDVNSSIKIKFYKYIKYSETDASDVIENMFQVGKGGLLIGLIAICAI